MLIKSTNSNFNDEGGDKGGFRSPKIGSPLLNNRKERILSKMGRN
jgi:hypothetical protein